MLVNAEGEPVAIRALGDFALTAESAPEADIGDFALTQSFNNFDESGLCCCSAAFFEVVERMGCYRGLSVVNASVRMAAHLKARRFACT